MPNEQFERFLKIAEDRFDAGMRIAFIPLWGDPERNRNFAGIWVEKDEKGYSGKLDGLLLGDRVHQTPYGDEDLREFLSRALLIWESYAFPEP